MRNYEIMFIVRPTLGEDEIKKVASNFQKTLETNGAKVTGVDAWGQKTLAYEIKVGRNTYKSGYYFVVTIEAGDDKAVKEFDRLALISQDVIRHLIINKED
jgi:small subunit ribosomal protein S6